MQIIAQFPLLVVERAFIALAYSRLRDFGSIFLPTEAPNHSHVKFSSVIHPLVKTRIMYDLHCDTVSASVEITRPRMPPIADAVQFPDLSSVSIGPHSYTEK